MTKQNRGTAISGSPRIPGRGGRRRAFRSTGARPRRASAGRWSAPSMRASTATRSARMAAPMRSIARSRFRPARSSPIARPDLTNTSPVVEIGPLPQWSRAGQASSRSIPWGHRVAEDFAPGDRRGRRHPPDHRDHQGAADACPRSTRRSRPGRLKVDGTIMQDTGDVAVTKAAVDPVWYLPGIAERFGVERRRAAPHAVRADRRHVSGAGHAAGSLGVPAADRRHHALHLRRSVRRVATSAARSPAACTTSATARTCSAPTSAPAGPISSTASRSASSEAQNGGAGPDRLQSQGRPRARRGDQVPGLQRPQAPGRRRPGGDLFRAHRMRRRRAGRALPAADAGRAPLARHHAASTASSRCRT